MKILFAGGGTAGHINPALAVAGYIKEHRPDAEISYIGTAEKLEAKLVPAAGYDFHTIEVAGFQRKISFKSAIKNIKAARLAVTASIDSKKLLRQLQPDLVVGTGGYVSGPVLKEAQRLGFKTAIHEQNAYPGVTNKALAKTVDKVMLTVKKAEEHLECKNEPVVTGLPVRSEIIEADREFSRAKLGVSPASIMVLSMGGSLGAKAINENMTALIAERWQNKNLFFMHSTGKYGKWVPEKLKELGVDENKASNVVIREYIDDMDVCLAASDLVIGRAGASSLSEIEAVGRASILIPSPNVAENHQYHNAMALVENDAARVIEEKDLTSEKLISEFDSLVADRETLVRLGRNAKKMAVENSSAMICDIIEKLAEKK